MNPESIRLFQSPIVTAVATYLLLGSQTTEAYLHLFNTFLGPFLFLDHQKYKQLKSLDIAIRFMFFQRYSEAGLLSSGTGRAIMMAQMNLLGNRDT